MPLRDAQNGILKIYVRNFQAILFPEKDLTLNSENISEGSVDEPGCYHEHRFIKCFGDERETCFCAYCGSVFNTRDHIPSKVLLDSPYPNDLPVVGACKTCNNSFSLDEEYLACFLECVLSGSTDPEKIRREKIRKILIRKPDLAKRIEENTRLDLWGNLIFEAEVERIQNVLVKLAKGHVVYDLNMSMPDPPSIVSVFPLTDLSEQGLKSFEAPSTLSLFPEVGSRAFQRIFQVGALQAHWVKVQKGMYRYLADPGPPLTIRMVLSEYMGSVVSWE